MVSSQLACFCCFFPLFLSHEGALRRILVLLRAAAAEIHPPQVVPVCYPMVGAQADAFAVGCGVPAHGTWEVRKKGGGGGHVFHKKGFISGSEVFFRALLWKENAPPAEDSTPLACLSFVRSCVHRRTNLPPIP